MPSNTSKGNYYKKKTKDFYIGQGYHTEILEISKRVYLGPDKPLVNVKYDILGADGVSASDTEFILWNSITNRSDIGKHIKRFKAIPCPRFIKRYLILWEPRAREPELIEVDTEGLPDD